MAAINPPSQQGGDRGKDQALPFFDSITRRNSIRGILLFIVLVAFLPTLGLSAWQGIARLTRDRAADERRLGAAAILISQSKASVIADSRQLLAVLAVIPAVRSGDAGRCGPVLAEAVKRLPGYSQFSVSGPDGRLVCASDPRAGPTSLHDPILQAQRRVAGFMITPPVWDQVLQRPVLHAILPLKTVSGEFDGVITASIDLVWLRRVLVQHQDRETAAIALVDGVGRPIARSRSLPWDRVVMPDAGASRAGVSVLSAPDGDGDNWSYAVAPLHIADGGGESFSIVYAALQPTRFGSDWWFAAAYLVLPLLALALAASAIWFGANRAILRWVSRLGELARQIGAGEGGKTHARPHFGDAPSEVRDLAAELLRVGNAITDREHRLRQSVVTQTEVARELHHRVRNNLQVMASFLSLQAESLPPGPARQVLAATQLRVATMAMVNGLLYADAEVTTVSLAELLAPIGDLLARHSGIAAHVSVDPELALRPVDIDRAMPLSLWIVEAAVCLFERVDVDHKPRRFGIAISGEDDLICVVVTMRGPLPSPSCQSLHRRLVTAIAQQLGGQAQIDAMGTGGAKVVLNLPHIELSGGPGPAHSRMATDIAA
jgi:hypothetical protein